MIEAYFIAVESEGDDGDVGGGLFDNFVMTSTADWKFQQFAVAAGYKEAFDAMSDEDMSKVYKQAPVNAKVKIESYTKDDGSIGQSPRVEWFEGYTGEFQGTWKSIITSAAEWYAEKYGSDVGATTLYGTGVANTASDDPTKGYSDEEIPF